jgi:excisionase family DNA binding protein
MSDTTPDTISAAERRRLLLARTKAGTVAPRSGRYGKRPLDGMSAAERRKILAERKAAAKAQRERGDVLALRRIEALGGANPEVEPATVSVNEFVVLVGVSAPTVHRWIKRGVIKGLMLGGRRLIPYSEVKRLRGEG